MYEVDAWNLQRKRECVHFFFFGLDLTQFDIIQHNFKAVIHVFFHNNIKRLITNLIYLSLLAVKSIVIIVCLLAAHPEFRFGRTAKGAVWNDWNSAADGWRDSSVQQDGWSEYSTIHTSAAASPADKLTLGRNKRHIDGNGPLEQHILFWTALLKLW